MADQRTGVYPGTFDPVTNGHVDIIGRALKVVGHLVIGVAANLDKEPLFTIEERIQMMQGELAEAGYDGRIEVRAFDNLLMDFVGTVGATMIVRGLRAVTDFDAEFSMALTNRSMWDEFDTVYLMTSAEYMFLRSSTVKQIAQHGGDISRFVPSSVEVRLRARFGN